jgi:hypothetical protein
MNRNFIFNKAGLFFLATILFLQSCVKQNDVEPQTQQPQANNYSPAVAVEWMDMTRQIVKSEGKNPPVASRIYAYAGITVYESVYVGLPNNKSVAAQIPGFNNLPKVSSFGELDFPAVVNEAMYRVSLKIAGNLKQENLNAIKALHEKYSNERLKAVPFEVMEASTEYGKTLAIAILNRADNDNFSATRSLAYTVPNWNNDLGNWAPTDNVNMSPLEPHWGKVKCFAMKSSDECETPSAVAFSTTPGSPFYNQALEVVTVSQNLTQEQKNIARWWADGGGTPTPPGHWLAIENQLVGKLNLSLGKAAEMYVLVNMALADAFISCWDAKFKFNLLRPKTYINKYIPGNSNWNSFIGTPPFPEYPSGHSVSSGAAAEILTTLFGSVAFTDNANINMGLQPRSFSSFYDAANEAADSRLYGGIHYREANENGVKQGKMVGQSVMKNIKLK